MKTYHQKASEIQREWLVVDAENQVLGRLATQVATLIRGKHKPTYTPSNDGGDYVIVINADKIRVTGDKANQKIYYRHTNYPGGLKKTTYKVMLQKNPDRIIRIAVKGMLPRNRLSRHMLLKLKVYAGSSHPHSAQSPKPYALKG
ncbi:MAG TPA: 50S ribosomal protein L13 [Herpetosiphonaceae bacterium]|nr:50S ribosomal protein L13 [Herpetosiphonaceae bacterium]